MEALPAQGAKQANSIFTLFAVAMFPRIKEIVIVSRLVGEMKIFVAVWSWKNTLEWLATR